MPTPDLDRASLEAFRALAEELSFRRAADRLGLDQSALSRRIRALEDRVGCRLARRTTREVTLTEAGRRFYEHAGALLRGFAEAVAAARDAEAGETGRLRIAYTSFAAADAMPRAVRAAAEALPLVTLELRYMGTEAQKRALAEREIDAGFLLGPVANPALETRLAARERLMAVMAPDHPLAARAAVSPVELAGARLALGAFGEWEFFRWRLDQIFAEAGVAPGPPLEASDAAGLLGLAAAGLGVTVHTEGLLRLAPQGLALRPIVGAAGPALLDTLLAWRRDDRRATLRRTLAAMRRGHGPLQGALQGAPHAAGRST